MNKSTAIKTEAPQVVDLLRYFLGGVKHRLGMRVHTQASFCLYGPSGTGKSQLARHIADELGKPILIKRASDLLDKYVGETEKLMAKMFDEALDEDAVLLLDEADSYLSDRSRASQHWEISQKNELLTQMECLALVQLNGIW